MKKQIQKLIKDAIKSAFGIDFDAEKIKVDYPPEGMGDFSTNVALLLAKEVGKNPMEVAEALKEKLGFKERELESSRGEKPSFGFAKTEIAKPGFTNFWLAEKSLQLVAVEINKEKNK